MQKRTPSFAEGISVKAKFIFLQLVCGWALTSNAAIAESFRFPLDGNWVPTRGFNVQVPSGGITDRYHSGEDYAFVDGTFEAPVYAAGAGVVKHSRSRTSYGNVVVIEHLLADGTYVCSVYGHLRADNLVGVNVEVSKGDVIGYLSSDHAENGDVNTHCHFGIRTGRYSEDLDNDQQFRYRGYASASIIPLWRNPSEFVRDASQPVKVVSKSTGIPIFGAMCTVDGIRIGSTDSSGQIFAPPWTCGTKRWVVTLGNLRFEGQFTLSCPAPLLRSAQPAAREKAGESSDVIELESTGGCPPRQIFDFAVDDTVVVFGTGIGLRGRAPDPCSSTYTNFPDGTRGIIKGGPQCCNGYQRWLIRYEGEAVDRWSAEGEPETGELFLRKVGSLQGSLRVTITPQAAVDAGAQWRVDDGVYRNSGATVSGLSPGTHPVTFKSVSGFTKPSDQTVTLAGGATTLITGNYSSATPNTYTLTLNNNGSPQGYTTPQPFGSGGSNYTAGASVQLTATANYGYHFVGWGGDVSGSANPTTIVMNGNKSVTANFAPGDPSLGTLAITFQPPEAAAAGVTWGFNDNDFRASGTSLPYWPGTYLIFVHGTNGWIGSGGWVKVTAGQTTNAVFTLSSTTGSTVGTDPRSYFTLAGLAGNVGSTDNTNSAARFNQPAGLAVDGGGNVYVADYYNHTIRKTTPAGAVSTLAGLAGSEGSTDDVGSAARFSYPNGVAVDNASNVYVADLYNHTIRKITPDGMVSTQAGLAGNIGSTNGTGSTARFNFPAGVAVDGDGNVYVAELWNHTIRKITPAGVVSTLAGLAGSHGSANGVGSEARFYFPNAVAVDNAGNVYVADTENQTIRKITSDGTVSTLAGFPGSGGAADGTGNVARFLYPTGVAVDNAGNVYVADNNNDTIRKITPAGVVTTLAGLSGKIGSIDGNGSTVRFNRPSGVALDSATNVFVADAQNHTIRATHPLVAKADQAITFALLQDKSVDDVPFAVNATASSGLLVTLSIVSGPATVSSDVVTLTGAGVVTVRASQSGNASFNAAPDVDRSFAVAKLPQFITFGGLSRQTLGDASFPLVATTSSGLPVSFAVLSGPASLNGNLITVTDIGVITVRASQAGDSYFAAAPNVDQSFSVAPGDNMIANPRRESGMFAFRFYGEPSQMCIIERSEDLQAWTSVQTNAVNSLGFVDFSISDDGQQLRSFFRAKLSE